MLYKSLVLFYRQGEVLGCQLNSMASQGFFYFTVGKIYGNGLWSILVAVVFCFFSAIILASCVKYGFVIPY